MKDKEGSDLRRMNREIKERKMAKGKHWENGRIKDRHYVKERKKERNLEQRYEERKKKEKRGKRR